MIGGATLVSLAITWCLNKAIPALFSHAVKQSDTQIELAKDLCDNHGDCEAQKALAMRGVKQVPKAEIIGPPAP